MLVINKMGQQSNRGEEILPVPKLMAATEKTFSYKVNHLFKMKWIYFDQLNIIHSIKTTKNDGLCVNLHNNIP